MFCQDHSILDWFSKNTWNEEDISCIFNRFNAVLNEISTGDSQKELSNINNKFVVDKEKLNEKRQKNFIFDDEILSEINNNIDELKDIFYNVNMLLTSKKEHNINTSELINPYSEEGNLNLIFLYLIELTPKIFDYIKGQILTCKNKKNFQNEKMHID